MEAIRIIDEMREATNGQYPKFAIWENVPGATSSGAGRDYQAVLSAFTKGKVPMPRSGKWANAGMVRGGGVDLAWCVYDAQYFGTAQRRRRLFLVCDFTGKRAGEVLFVPKSLCGYFEAGGTPRQGAAAFAESRPDTAGAGTLTAGNGRYQFIPQEVEILNDQGGESLSVERAGIAPTLRSQTHGNLPVIASTLCVGSGQVHAGILDDQSPTLTAAHEQPLLVHPQIAGTLCASAVGLSRPAGIGSEQDFCVVSAGFSYKAGSASGTTQRGAAKPGHYQQRRGEQKSAVPQKKNGTKTWDYFLWHDWDGLGVWVRLLSVWETASKIAVFDGPRIV